MAVVAGRSDARARAGEVGSHLRPQGAARARAHSRAQRARGADDPRLHAARRRDGHREGAPLRGRQRRGQPRPGRRRARRRGCLRRRGADAEALEATRTRSRQPHQQAHLPRHARARRGAGAEHQAPSAAEGRAGRRRQPRSPSRRPRRGARRRRRLPDGPESASRRLPRRRHPRLEVELVDGEARVRQLHPRGRSHPRAHPREALARGALGHPHPQGQAADHRGHLHGASRASSSGSRASRSTRSARSCMRSRRRTSTSTSTRSSVPSSTRSSSRSRSPSSSRTA